jgi:hypothetical protein
MAEYALRQTSEYASLAIQRTAEFLHNTKIVMASTHAPSAQILS